MSKNSSINKILRKSANRIEKARNPIDKLAQFGLNSTDIAHRVVRQGITEARKGADNMVDISAKRLRSAHDEQKFIDIVQKQIDFTSSDVRSMVDVARDSIDAVADGVVDTLDELSNSYDAYRADRKSGKFSAKGTTAKAKSAAPKAA